MAKRKEFGMHCQYAERVMHFLREIGIPVSLEPGGGAFIKHVAIAEGALRVDPRAPAAGLLHEAGHIAITPEMFRHYLNGDVGPGIRLIIEHAERLCLEPDSPLERAIIQLSDCEATAWAWAAGLHLGIPRKLIIQDGDYNGEGDDMRARLNANAYLGINGLAHAGFCSVRANPYRPKPVYPQLAFWLQQAR